MLGLRKKDVMCVISFADASSRQRVRQYVGDAPMDRLVVQGFMSDCRLANFAYE